MAQREGGTAHSTHLHLIHNGIGAQDVVLLLRVGLCMLDSPGGLPAGGQANHHQDLETTTLLVEAAIGVGTLAPINNLFIRAFCGLQCICVAATMFSKDKNLEPKQNKWLMI